MVKNIIHTVLRWFYPIFKRFMPYPVYAYLAVGAANTALNIVLFALCYQVVLGPDVVPIGGFEFESYTISLLIAFILTVPTGFWLARYFVFNSEESLQGKASTQLGKYFLVVLQGLISDYLLLVALVEWVHMHPTVAKVLSTVIVLTANYLLQKFYTFKAPKST